MLRWDLRISTTIAGMSEQVETAPAPTRAPTRRGASDHRDWRGFNDLLRRRVGAGGHPGRDPARLYTGADRRLPGPISPASWLVLAVRRADLHGPDLLDHLRLLQRGR